MNELSLEATDKLAELEARLTALENILELVIYGDNKPSDEAVFGFLILSRSVSTALNDFKEAIYA